MVGTERAKPRGITTLFVRARRRTSVAVIRTESLAADTARRPSSFRDFGIRRPCVDWTAVARALVLAPVSWPSWPGPGAPQPHRPSVVSAGTAAGCLSERSTPCMRRLITAAAA